MRQSRKTYVKKRRKRIRRKKKPDILHLEQVNRWTHLHLDGFMYIDIEKDYVYNMRQSRKTCCMKSINEREVRYR